MARFIRTLGEKKGPQFSHHRDIYHESERKAKGYRAVENSERKKSGQGILLKSRYDSILKKRSLPLSRALSVMEHIGNRYQQKTLQTAIEVLRVIEQYAKDHCARRCVTLTKDYVFNAPVSEISQLVCMGKKETNSYMILLSALGVLKRIRHEERRGESYIGKLGIRAQDYTLPMIREERLIDRWDWWCHNGGAISRVNEQHIADVFGLDVAEDIYLTPEAKGHEFLRVVQREQRNDPDYWANNNTHTNFFVEYRRARQRIKSAIRDIKKHTSRVFLEPENGGLVRRYIPCNDRRAKVELMNGSVLWLSNDDILNVSKMLKLWSVMYKYDRRIFRTACQKHGWWHDTRAVDLTKIWNIMVAWFPHLFWDENGERREFGTTVEKEDSTKYFQYYAPSLFRVEIEEQVKDKPVTEQRVIETRVKKTIEIPTSMVPLNILEDHYAIAQSYDTFNLRKKKLERRKERIMAVCKQMSSDLVREMNKRYPDDLMKGMNMCWETIQKLQDERDTIIADTESELSNLKKPIEDREFDWNRYRPANIQSAWEEVCDSIRHFRMPEESKAQIQDEVRLIIEKYIEKDEDTNLLEVPELMRACHEVSLFLRDNCPDDWRGFSWENRAYKDYHEHTERKILIDQLHMNNLMRQLETEAEARWRRDHGEYITNIPRVG